MTLIRGDDKAVAEWVSQQLFDDPYCYNDQVRAIGVMKDGKMIAGVTYTNYQPEVSIEMSIATIDKSWATRQNIRAFFEYPFIKLGLKRVSTQCSDKRDIIVFNEKLGFTKEGYHRFGYHDGSNCVSFGMLKNECRWIK
jgi:RimJ/RimL family protein N-acetyltransferase